MQAHQDTSTQAVYNELLPGSPSKGVELLAENDISADTPQNCEGAASALPAGMTPEQLAEAKQYGRYSLACTLADKLLDLLFLTFAAVVLARPLDTWLQGFPLLQRFDSLRLVVFFLLVMLLHVAVSLSLSFYSGYVLEHRFHLSTLSVGGWVRRYLKQNLLGLALGTVLILGLYWLIWTTGGWWWLAAAGAFFCVTIIMGRVFPVLIMPLFYKIEPLEAPELAERMNALAAGTGLTIEGCYRIALSEETVKANAMLAGLGRTRRVLLGDTLLNNFSAAEIAVVFAHEIGHHVFRHVRKMILLGLVVSVAGFWICDRTLTYWAAGGQPLDYARLPVWTEPWIMLVLSLFGLLLEPLMNGISRRHERQCDRYALERTRQPEAYVAAFSKLARQNKDDPCPHWFEVFWLHDHPPIGERLAIAQRP
jgi:STE24 endopeptidase